MDIRLDSGLNALQGPVTARSYHTGEEDRWDYRVTIVWKNATLAHDDYDCSVDVKRIFPDQETFKREEQRRFESCVGRG